MNWIKRNWILFLAGTLIFMGSVPISSVADSWNSDGKFDRVWWDDLRLPGLASLRGASAPDLVTYGPSGNLLCNGFDGAVTTEQVFAQAQFPHRMEPGTDIEPHVHWSPTTADAGDIEWKLEYIWVGVNETAGAPTTIECQDTSTGTAWDHLIADCGTISNSGNEGISSMLTIRLYRDPTDGNDTYAADACLNEVDFHFQISSPGSRQEFIK